MFITIRGERHYFWRAVDQDEDVIDILVTKHRGRQAAKRNFPKALKHQGQAPWQLVTDKLRTYRAAYRRVFPSVMHRTGRYENNRAEVFFDVQVIWDQTFELRLNILPYRVEPSDIAQRLQNTLVIKDMSLIVFAANSADSLG
jgi:hypothetical protein